MTNREKATKEIRRVWLDAALRKEELVTVELD
jgi:hypothetical protein